MSLTDAGTVTGDARLRAVARPELRCCGDLADTGARRSGGAAAAAAQAFWRTVAAFIGRAPGELRGDGAGCGPTLRFSNDPRVTP